MPGLICSAVRDYALSLACAHRELPTAHGRGLDQLPESVRNALAGALVTSLTREELLRALSHAVSGLCAEIENVGPLGRKVEPQLHKLTAVWE